MNPYRIPAQRHRTELLVVNSRFITTIAAVATVDAARDTLKAVRTEMPDANHHVYAYRVGYGSSVIEGMSDDGEPSGTAGPPVLAVLRGSQIGDILIVVTRYFGGTKLGTGGLVRAYTEAAQTGLASLPTELKIAKVLLGLELPYSLYEPVRRLVAHHEGVIRDEDFANDVTLMVEFPEDHVSAFSAAVVELSAGRIHPVRVSD